MNKLRQRLTRASWLLWFLFGCSGPAFEQDSSAGSELAGSPSVAGSLSAGGSILLSGAAGVVATGNEAGNSVGGESAGGAPPDVAGGAAGDGATRPCDVSTWTAQAFASRELATSPAAALDGAPSTRWTSGTAQAKGQWFALELGAGVDLVELELRSVSEPDDVPSSLELELDGQPTPATLERPAAGVLRLRFRSTPATSARLTLSASSAAWWSIAELGGLCK